MNSVGPFNSAMSQSFGYSSYNCLVGKLQLLEEEQKWRHAGSFPHWFPHSSSLTFSSERLRTTLPLEKYFSRTEVFHYKVLCEVLCQNFRHFLSLVCLKNLILLFCFVFWILQCEVWLPEWSLKVFGLNQRIELSTSNSCCIFLW